LLAAFSGLALAYWGFRFGMSGVQISGRPGEKLCVIGQDAPKVPKS
jgi:hypothetical protein